MSDTFSLSSGNLSGGTYDENTDTLTLTFQGGGEYLYRGVPRPVVEGLKIAPSPGSYFHANIRGKYQTEKLG